MSEVEPEQEVDKASTEIVEEEVAEEKPSKDIVKTVVSEAKKKAMKEEDDEDEDEDYDDEELDVSDDDMEDDEDEEKNESSCKKEDVQYSEDVLAIFEGEELSEEFKQKVALIFESAVAAKINVELQELTEAVRAEFEAEQEKIVTELTEAVEKYASYAAKTWIDENKLVLESNLKTELVEDFIHGMKNLFSEHYIDLPDEAVDVVEEMTAKVENLESQLAEAVSKVTALTEEVNVKKKVVVLEETISELSENQKEKIRSLAEGVAFESEESFKEKIATLITSYYPKEKVVVTEDVELAEEVLPESTNPVMAHYAAAISRTVVK